MTVSPDKFVEMFKECSCYEEHLMRLTCEGTDISSDEEFFDFCVERIGEYKAMMSEKETELKKTATLSEPYFKVLQSGRIIDEALHLAKRAAMCLIEDHPEFKSKYQERLRTAYGEAYLKTVADSKDRLLNQRAEIRKRQTDEAMSYVDMFDAPDSIEGRKDEEIG